MQQINDEELGAGCQTVVGRSLSPYKKRPRGGVRPQKTDRLQPREPHTS